MRTCRHSSSVRAENNTMPKKKKKKDGKKKGNGGDQGKDKDAHGTQKVFEPPGASEKEIILRTELDELNFELKTLKKQVNDLRLENDWLQKEADQTKQETHDYQTYISRKADKRQSLIVSLSDHYHQQLQAIAKEKEELIRDYEEKKSRLTTILLEKEGELCKIKQELKTLEPFKVLKSEQEDEIQLLEHQLEEEKFSHEDKVRSIKTQFLKEKKVLEEASDEKIREMTVHANKEASECLKKHTQQIKVENQQLSQELQELIEATNGLQLHKKRLEKQYRSLLREHQFSQNLKQLRGSVFRGGKLSSELELGLEQGSDIALPQLRLP